MTTTRFTRSLSNVRVRHAVPVGKWIPRRRTEARLVGSRELTAAFLSRKKARCPGEKPACSLCQRLGQRCVYGQSAPPNRVRANRTSASNGPDGSPDAWREVCRIIKYTSQGFLVTPDVARQAAGKLRVRDASSISSNGLRRSRVFFGECQSPSHCSRGHR